VREFSTAGRKAPEAFENAGPIEFVIDGETFTAYPPTPGQVAMLMVAQASNRGAEDNIAGIIDFLDGILEEDAQVTFRRRLMDRDDPFDFDMVEEIVEGLIEEWSDRPTQPSSASSSSRTTGGAKSTARPRSRAKTSASSR